MIITESRLRSTIHKILLAEAVKNRHGYVVNSISDVKWSSQKIGIPKDSNPFIGSSDAFESWYNDGQMVNTFRVMKNAGTPDEKGLIIKNDIFFPIGSFVIIPELWSAGLERVVYQVAPPGIYQLSAGGVAGIGRNDSVPVVAIRDPVKPGMPGIENIGIAFLRKVGGPKADPVEATAEAREYMLAYKGHNEDAPGTDTSQSAARPSVRRRPGETTPRPPVRPRDMTLSAEERAKLLGISENKLRQIIREALLRENMANDFDDFLQFVDNTLTALDVATAAASLSVVLAPATGPANRVISFAGGLVDFAQIFTSIAKDPPDYEAACVNLFSCIISFLVDHALGTAATTALKHRKIIVEVSLAVADWWSSRDKITLADAEGLKKEIQKNPEPDVGESENIDDGESDGSPDPVLPALPQKTRPERPSLPSSDCPTSKRFAFKYNSWGGSIQDMLEDPPITVTVDLKVGALLGDTGWTIKNVQTDNEGQPTQVKIIHTSGNCLLVLPLDSLE
jgi:predicted DNA binding protein